MKKGIVITFRHGERSDVIDEIIENYADETRRKYGEKIRFEVIVDIPNRRRRNCNLADVRIQVHVPNHGILSARNHWTKKDGMNIFTAIEKAFSSLAHELEHRLNKSINRHKKPETFMDSPTSDDEYTEFLVH